MNKNKTNIAKINDIEYMFDIILANNNNDFVPLSQSSVRMLSISDNVFEPFVDAEMVIDNSLNALQRGFKTSDGRITEASFDFNLYDTDYIFVKLTPILYAGQNEGDINDEVWTLQYTFAIVDMEDIPSDDPEKKFKRLFLHERDKDIMLRKTSNFSTSKYVTSTIKPYLRDNEDNMVKTGFALKSMIKEALTDAEIDPDWDDGKNDIFYTSPISQTYYDDLLYLYNSHQSAIDSDFCILQKSRFRDIWKLNRFSDIVSKALNQTDKTKSGELQSETFIIAEGGSTATIPKSRRVPTNYGINNNMFFGDLSKLEDYRMVEISNYDASESIKTTIAHSYDFNDGKFRIEHYDLVDTQTYFTDNYATKLNKPLFKNSTIFKTDTYRLQNRNVAHTYGSLHKAENTLEFLSRNKVLQSAYSLNLALEFTTIGMTHRQAGTFFSIQRENDYVPSEYENKLQGQWFCMSVQHSFIGESYTNSIVGVKLNKLE